jgi:hypothetical protein
MPNAADAVASFVALLLVRSRPLVCATPSPRSNRLSRMRNRAEKSFWTSPDHLLEPRNRAFDMATTIKINGIDRTVDVD